MSDSRQNTAKDYNRCTTPKMIKPAELAALCQGAKTAWSALGSVNYGRKFSELGNVKFRRSLYFVKDLKAGDIITEDAVRSVRPGFGLPPKMFDQIIGKIVNQDVCANMPIEAGKIKDYVAQ